jgi:hypothetical protein
MWDETAKNIEVIWVGAETKYFCARGLDDPNQIDFANEFSFFGEIPESATPHRSAAFPASFRGLRSWNPESCRHHLWIPGSRQVARMQAAARIAMQTGPTIAIGRVPRQPPPVLPGMFWEPQITYAGANALRRFLPRLRPLASRVQAAFFFVDARQACDRCTRGGRGKSALAAGRGLSWHRAGENDEATKVQANSCFSAIDSHSACASRTYRGARRI